MQSDTVSSINQGAQIDLCRNPEDINYGYSQNASAFMKAYRYFMSVLLQNT